MTTFWQPRHRWQVMAMFFVGLIAYGQHRHDEYWPMWVCILCFIMHSLFPSFVSLPRFRTLLRRVDVECSQKVIYNIVRIRAGCGDHCPSDDSSYRSDVYDGKSIRSRSVLQGTIPFFLRALSFVRILLSLFRYVSSSFGDRTNTSLLFFFFSLAVELGKKASTKILILSRWRWIR